MKKCFTPVITVFLAAVLLFAACNTADSSLGETEYTEAVFSRGVNFSGWFEASSPRSISFTKYTEQDFADAKSLGVGIIRLPIKLHAMTGSAPAYTLDPLFLEFLDKAVDWAEKYKMYIILDNHSFDPVAATADDINLILIPVWRQMASHFKNRGKYVLYEILNEPHGISAERWGVIQGEALKAIRSVDPVHTIIVGGVDYNSIGKLFSLPAYTESNIIYTFHFYDPYLFTHQGETWSSPPNLANLKEVPFPASAHEMPVIPDELKGTWIEDSFNSYAQAAKTETLAEALDYALQFSTGRGGVPLFCGEFGAYMINSRNEDRVRWYQTVTKLLDERNIARTSWDYTGAFGLFTTPAAANIYSDINVDIAVSQGFTPPKQRAQEKIKTGFYLYDDYPGQGIIVTCWGAESGSLFDLYSAPAGSEGKYALLWGNANQYDQFHFIFNRGIDWAYLKNQGYCLRFRACSVKAQSVESPLQFDIRFINPENDAAIPWRMGYTLNESKLPPDGVWHTIEIPLAAMTDQGAWINAAGEWRGSEGLFDWDTIESLQFVAETGALKDCSIWFDSIRIEK